jgi:hypothetical protein
MNTTTNPKMKIAKGRGVGARSLARSTSGVERRDEVLGWGLGKLTSDSLIYTNLHKPINKLVKG